MPLLLAVRSSEYPTKLSGNKYSHCHPRDTTEQPPVVHCILTFAEVNFSTLDFTARTRGYQPEYNESDATPMGPTIHVWPGDTLKAPPSSQRHRLARHCPIRQRLRPPRPPAPAAAPPPPVASPGFGARAPRQRGRSPPPRVPLHHRLSPSARRAALPPTPLAETHTALSPGPPRPDRSVQ